MSIHYDLYDTPDIQQTGDAQPLHPRVVFKGTVDQEEFLDRVHKFTGISRSLLAGAMQSFQNELRDLIANGWIVELGDIGYFSVSLKGPRVMKKKDVHAQSIELKNVNFRVSSQFNLNSATHIVRNKFKILSNNILPSILPCQKIHLT